MRDLGQQQPTGIGWRLAGHRMLDRAGATLREHHRRSSESSAGLPDQSQGTEVVHAVGPPNSSALGTLSEGSEAFEVEAGAYRRRTAPQPVGRLGPAGEQ